MMIATVPTSLVPSARTLNTTDLPTADSFSAVLGELQVYDPKSDLGQLTHEVALNPTATAQALVASFWQSNPISVTSQPIAPIDNSEQTYQTSMIDADLLQPTKPDQAVAAFKLPPEPGLRTFAKIDVTMLGDVEEALLPAAEGKQNVGSKSQVIVTASGVAITMPGSLGPTAHPVVASVSASGVTQPTLETVESSNHPTYGASEGDRIAPARLQNSVASDPSSVSDLLGSAAPQNPFRIADRHTLAADPGRSELESPAFNPEKALRGSVELTPNPLLQSIPAPEKIHNPTLISNSLSIDASSSQTISNTNMMVDRHLDMARQDLWLDELARDIMAARHRNDIISLRLMPDQLGRLDIEVTQNGNGMFIQMTASNPEAASLIASAQPRLTEELRSQGLRLVETQVRTSDTADGASSQSQRQNREALQHLPPEAAGPTTDSENDQPAARLDGRFA